MLHECLWSSAIIFLSSLVISRPLILQVLMSPTPRNIACRTAHYSSKRNCIAQTSNFQSLQIVSFATIAVSECVAVDLRRGQKRRAPVECVTLAGADPSEARRRSLGPWTKQLFVIVVFVNAISPARRVCRLSRFRPKSRQVRADLGDGARGSSPRN
jgi:hypothetical protein